MKARGKLGNPKMHICVPNTNIALTGSMLVLDTLLEQNIIHDRTVAEFFVKNNNFNIALL